VDEPSAAALGSQHPIRLHITDDLRRTRLTAFFRLLLAIPHFLWLMLLAIVVILAAIGNWFATLFNGRSPLGLHTFLAGYLRYSTHVSAYLFLIADPFPGFYLLNLKPKYPIDLEVGPPVEQNRWTVGFRILLAIPAIFVTNILRNLSSLLAVFSWVLAVLTGRVPEGIRNFAALALRYESQTYGYILLLTPRYPSFDVGITA
jgi:Domain of unknown function (DUF4389)